MLLIELLRSDLSQFNTDEGYAQAVFLRNDQMAPPSKELSEEEIHIVLKNKEIKIEPHANIFDQPGWTFIGSTEALRKALEECRIENIDEEFGGFCMVQGW